MVYISTDLDVFPPEIFRTGWSEGSRADFDISTYKRIVQQLTLGKGVIFADFTGLVIQGLVNPMEHCSTDLAHLSLEERTQVIARETKKYEKQNAGIAQENTTALDNLVDLIRFMQPLLKVV